jgi:hypothetical protein
MQTHLYSVGYATHITQAGSVCRFNLAVAELKIEPVQFIDDVPHFDGDAVVKVQRYFEQERKNEVTR